MQSPGARHRLARDQRGDGQRRSAAEGPGGGHYQMAKQSKTAETRDLTRRGPKARRSQGVILRAASVQRLALRVIIAKLTTAFF